MTQELLITNTFEHVGGFPQDRIVNTFPVAWTGAGSPSNAQLDLALEDVENFYKVIAGGFTPSDFLSDEIDRTVGVSVLRAYNLVGHLDGSAHGSPIRSRTWTLNGTPGSFSLPAECAAVLTTRANGWAAAPVETPDGVDPGTAVDRPRQRLSGRLFIGPLSGKALDKPANVWRVESDMITCYLAAANALNDALVTDGFQWMVWSRVNAAMEPVTHVQMDDAFDTQRRRGPDPSVRTTVAV